MSKNFESFGKISSQTFFLGVEYIGDSEMIDMHSMLKNIFNFVVCCPDFGQDVPDYIVDVGKDSDGLYFIRFKG